MLARAQATLRGMGMGQSTRALRLALPATWRAGASSSRQGGGGSDTGRVTTPGQHLSIAATPYSPALQQPNGGPATAAAAAAVLATTLLETPAVPLHPIATYSPAVWRHDIMLRFLRRHAPPSYRARAGTGVAMLFGCVNAVSPAGRQAARLAEAAADGVLAGLPGLAPVTPPEPSAVLTDTPLIITSADMRAAVRLMYDCWLMTRDPGIAALLRQLSVTAISHSANVAAPRSAPMTSSDGSHGAVNRGAITSRTVTREIRAWPLSARMKHA